MPRQRINAIGGIGFSTDLNPVDIPLQGLTSMRNVKCEDKKLVCVDGEKAALSDIAFGLPQPMTEHFTYKDTDGKW